MTTFNFDTELHEATANDDLGAWQLTDCVPVKTEDLSPISNDLTRITSADPSLNIDGLSTGTNGLFKVTDTDRFRDVIPLVDDTDRENNSDESFGISVGQRALMGGEHNGPTDGSNVGEITQSSGNVQGTLIRQPRAARIGKAASLAVLLASNSDSAKCDLA